MARKITLILTFLSLSLPAHAWESQTHAGIAARAAAQSNLDELLKAAGKKRGLETVLTLKKSEAPKIYATVAKFSPSCGFVPHNEKLPAKSWIALGAAVADLNSGQHHFLDPTNKRGLKSDPPVASKLTSRALKRKSHKTGLSALKWLGRTDRSYPIEKLSMQLKNISQLSDAELAKLLVSIGNALHVLSDMSSPAHVRNDAESLVQGTNRGSLMAHGSRFEKVAHLAFGRIAMPNKRVAVPVFSTWEEYFHNSSQSGLADIVSRRFFSESTLPRTIPIRPGKDLKPNTSLSSKIAGSLQRPKPRVPEELDIIAAQSQWARLENKRGTCIAEYKVTKFKLHWKMSDQCMREQQKELLPVTIAYGAGLINTLAK